MAKYSFSNTDGLNDPRAIIPRLSKQNALAGAFSDLASCESLSEVIAMRNDLYQAGLIQETLSMRELDGGKGIILKDGRGESVTLKRGNLSEEEFSALAANTLRESIAGGLGELGNSLEGTRPHSMFRLAGLVFGRPRTAVGRFLKRPFFIVPALIVGLPFLPAFVAGILGIGLARREAERLSIALSGRVLKASANRVAKLPGLKPKAADAAPDESRDRDENSSVYEELEREREALEASPREDFGTEEDEIRETIEEEIPDYDEYERQSADAELDTEPRFRFSERSGSDARQARLRERERAARAESPGESRRSAGQPEAEPRTGKDEMESRLDGLRSAIVGHLGAIASLTASAKIASRPEDTLLLVDEVIRSFRESPTPERFASAVSQLEEIDAMCQSEKEAFEVEALSSGRSSLISPEEKVKEALAVMEGSLRKASASTIPLYPAQNVNGKLYHGMSQYILLTHMSRTGSHIPVFLTEEQVLSHGLRIEGEGVLLMHSQGGEIHGQKVYNLKETDFASRFPEVFRSLDERFSVRMTGAREVKQFYNALVRMQKQSLSARDQSVAAAVLSATLGLSAAQADSAKTMAGSSLILDGTFQDSVRGIMESGGLSIEALSGMSGNIGKILSTTMKLSEVPRGIDIDKEIESVQEGMDSTVLLSADNGVAAAAEDASASMEIG